MTGPSISEGTVQAALDTLRGVAKKSLSYPTPLLRQLKLSQEPESFVAAICEEFQDRPEYAVNSIRMLSDAVRVGRGKQKFDRQAPLWPQLTSEGYESLVLLMNSLLVLRQQQTAPRDSALDYFSECDMKFVFSEYLAKARAVTTAEELAQFDAERKAYVSSALKTGNCTQLELDTLNVFRGQATLWPTSPEASTMRNASLYFRGECRAERQGESAVAQKECAQYFENPFRARLGMTEAARRAIYDFPAGAFPSMNDVDRALIIFDSSSTVGNAAQFDLKTSAGIALASEFEALSSSYISRNFKQYEAERKLFTEHLRKARSGKQIGLTEYQVNESLPESRQDETADRLKRLEVLFNRHFDYYSTAFASSRSDFLGLFHTPLMSASPYMSQAHKFTFPGYSMQGTHAPRMGWMFVFKIRKQDLYLRADAEAGKVPDFQKMWFDEAGFGTRTLGKLETAVDRVATPAPEEFAALLYLGDVAPSEKLLGIALYSPDNFAQKKKCSAE